MALTLKLDNRSGETKFIAAGGEYSMYTFLQLLKARYWVNSDGDPERSSGLEKEIQKRCAHIQETIRYRGPGQNRAGERFRLYGLMLGVACLVSSIGPFVVVELLAAINIVTDVDGDHARLSGFWALLTLPFAVIVFLIGGMLDAERVVKWLNL